MQLIRKLIKLNPQENLIAFTSSIRNMDEVADATNLIATELANYYKSTVGYTFELATTQIEEEEVPHVQGIFERGGKRARLGIVFNKVEKYVRPVVFSCRSNKLTEDDIREIALKPGPEHMSEGDFEMLKGIK